MIRTRIQFQNRSINIIPDKFVFSIEKLRPTKSFIPFSVDNDEHFQYQPFFEDFGPLPLHHIHYFMLISLNYLDQLEDMSKNENSQKNDTKTRMLNFYCCPIPQKISNAVLLAASFRLIHLKMTAEESLKPFAPILKDKSLIIPFRDASSYPSTYDLTILSCLKGLEKAISLGWYNPLNFDCQEWADCEMIENGDMNWLIPNKLMAFASPYPTNEVQGFYVCTPKEIVPAFQKYGITRIIRLNNKTYDENIFKDAGFKHTELYFPDGTNPPPTILKGFLDIIEGNDVIALHCKAGLGRTGTLAGCYMIKKFGFSAPEAIGWIRICRPGSIIGPQQQFLIDYDYSINYKQNHQIQENRIITHKKSNNVMSPLKSTNSFSSRKPSLSKPTGGNLNKNINKSPKASARQNRLNTTHNPYMFGSPSSPSNSQTNNHFSDRVSTASNSPRSKKKKDDFRIQTATPGKNIITDINVRKQSLNSFDKIENTHFHDNTRPYNGIPRNIIHQPTGITPKFPQPRKLKRAINASKREIR